MTLSRDQIEQLKAQHGEDLYSVEVPGTDGERVIVFRPCNRVEFKRFQSEANHDRKKDTATDNLIRSVVVYPPRAELDDLLDRFPGMTETVSNKVLEIAGLEDKAIAKKL